MKYRLLLYILTSLLFTVSLHAQDTVFNQLNSRGQKTGYWKKYYDNGKLKYQGYFENDKPLGIMRRYYKGGLPQAVIDFRPDSRTAHAQLFYENGKPAAEGNYINGKKDSTWIFYSFYNGRVAIKEDYSNGLRNGMSIKYYDNGEVSEKMEWKSNQKDGIWEQYYENGQLRLEARHQNGKREGQFRTFNPEGEPSVKGQYKQGVMDGKWIYYNDEGETDFEVQYVNGKMLPNKELEKRQEEFSKKIEENIGDFPDASLPEIR